MTSQSAKRQLGQLARVLAPVVVGLAFFVSAASTLALTRGFDAIAAFWPSNAMLLAGLLLAPKQDIWRYVIVGAAASMAANLHAGGSLILSAAFTVANLTEACLAAWLLRRRATSPSFIDPGFVGRFCAAAGAACLVSATLSTTLSGIVASRFAAAWFTTDFLGLLIVTPIIIVWVDLAQNRNADAAMRFGPFAATLLLASVTFTALLTFAQDNYPLLFLPVAILMPVTYWLGPAGATASVFLIAMVGSILTGFGRGPIALVQGSDAGLFVFQAYLLTLLASTLPVSALLATRDRLHRTLAEANRMLGMAEEATQVGHWRVDLRRQKVFWSPEVYRVHGVSDEEAPSMDRAFLAYHPDDRSMVASAIERTIATGASFEFEARVVRPDGTLRHIAAKGWPEVGAVGKVDAIFGVFQDITCHVEGRQAAERAACIAARLADTDQLTGLFNRRKVLELIDEALGQARRSNVPFSVAMLDVDHFKAVNDRWGHATGDRVLQRVADAAKATLREPDVIGRLGGEEFVLLLPSTNLEDALAVAERTRIAIEMSGTGTPDDPKVTASLGVATCVEDENAGALLGRADRALYEAKDAGRNTLRAAA